MKLLHKYQNGNAIITLFDNGTRIISTEDNEFNFEVPCNADIKISNYCVMGCPMCHEGSTPAGKHAPLSNFKFLESWGPGKECAFGGGMVTSYPHLKELLEYTKNCGLVANATFHQEEFINNYEVIKSYQEKELLNGIGVSFITPSKLLEVCANKIDNLVFHVIAGLVTLEDLNYIATHFKHPKILILGYKHFRRGKLLYNEFGEIIEKNIETLSKEMSNLIKMFEVISFDNLAIEQLKMKEKINSATWEQFYQGEEGLFNMYIDAVEGKFARNSTSNIRYDLTNNIKEMFERIKLDNENNKKIQ